MESRDSVPCPAIILNLRACVLYIKYLKYVRSCDIYVRSILLVATVLLSVRDLYLRSQHLICSKLYSGSQIFDQ